MSEYKLSYFNAMGRAEPVRLIFAYAGVEYEDERFAREEWPAKKESMPFGQVPVLFVNGKPLADSMSICRYLGKQFNLTGKDDWESAQCDAIVSVMGDLQQKMTAARFEQDPDRQKKLMEDVGTTYAPKYLGILEKHIQPSGYLVSDRITWPDILLSAFYDVSMKYRGEEMYADFPKIRALVEKVSGEPRIAAWKEKRPKTDF